MSSGKAKSQENKNGIRRIINGKQLAPKSARRRGKMWFDGCTENDLRIAQISKE